MEEELGDENVENEAKRHREDTPGEASAICACQERDQQGPPAAAELHHDAAEDRHEAAALDDIPALAAEEVDAAFLPLGPEAGPAADDMPGAAPASTDAAASEQVAPAQGRAAAGPAPSQAQSEMQPQCAVILGAALAAGRGGGATVEQEAAPPPVEPELSTNSPLDAATPSRQCAAVREELAQCLHPPTELGVPWDAFPNYLGEGARSRLLSLATLYLTAAGGRAPAAVRELAANSQRVLLGAANNCEFYQERVVRALAQRMGVPLLVADAYSLKLDDEEAPPTASFDELFGGGGGFTPDLGSDDEDFLTDIDKKDDKDRAASGRAAMRKPPFPTHRASVSVASLVPHVDRVRANANRVLAAAEAKQAAATKLAAAAMQAAGAAPAAKRGAASEQPQQGRPADMDQAAPAEEAGPSAVPPLIPEAEADAADKAAAQVVTEGVEPKLADKAGAAAAGAWGGAAAGADKAARSGAATEQASAARPAQEGKPRAAATATAAAAEGTGLQRAGSVDKAPGLPPSGLGAGAGQAAAAFKRGDRVSYLGRLPPGGSAAAERLEAIQAAISRMEAAGQSSRLRDYLPTIVLKSRSAALARQAERGAPQARMQLADAPPIGAKGRVVGLAGEKVEVVFEDPFPGGMSLVGQRERCGWACPPGDLAAAGDDREDAWLMSFTALFDVIKEEGEKGPLVVFVQNLDRLIRSSATDHFRKLEALLGGLPQRCLFFAAYCSRSLAREPTRPGGLGGMRLLGLGGLGGGAAGDSLGSALDDLPEIYRYGRLARGGAGSRKSSKGRTLACMLPNHIELHPPNQESLMKAWKQMVDADVAAMRTHANRVALRKALAKCGMACDDLEAVSIPDSQLGKREVEQLVGVAVAEQLAAEGERGGEEGAGVGEEGGSMEVQGEEEAPEGGAGAAEAAAAPAVDAPSGAPEAGPAEPAAAEGPRQQHVAAAAAVQQPPWELRATHIMAAAEAVRRLQAEAAAQSDRASALSQMAGDQYEKQLLSEVIPPEEISVQFDDIGALEQVKTTLHEVVILPLQRPELFTRGALTKPTKGLLLFGPPGTGKTMLAKAVASESGAHFINVNMSSLGSKWFGEGERLVRALFALAHKLVPSVVFVDEIDSFLSKRGDRGSEHEALRKMKNEFMSHWDGLRTKQNDRVLVLAATNRPMDLDDAVIRRMPRRIFVPLPDAANREKILRVILKDEELEPGFDFAELAAATDGYSGSDLKNLCIAAAYCPIREFLDAEREAKRAEAAAGASRAQPQRSVSQQPSQQPSQQQAPAAGGDGLARSASGSGRPPLGRPSVAAVAHVAPQPVAMRAICMADFKQAAKQVTASSCSDSATMSELKRWNDQYGEGDSRQKEQLAYYT